MQLNERSDVHRDGHDDVGIVLHTLLAPTTLYSGYASEHRKEAWPALVLGGR